MRVLFFLLFCLSPLYSEAPVSSQISGIKYYVPNLNIPDSCALFLSGGPEESLVTLKPQSLQRSFSFSLTGIPVVLDSLSAGYYNLCITKSGYEGKSALLLLSKNKIKRFHFILQPLNKQKALFYSFLLAGTGQFYARQYLKGNTFMFLESIAIGGLLTYQLKYQRDLKRFNTAQHNYRYNDDLSQMDILYQQLKDVHRQTKLTRNIRNSLIFAYAAVHIINVWDIINNWPFSKSKKKSVQLGSDFRGHNVLTVSYHF